MDGNLPERLGNEKFVSLKTFKRDGVGVASAMWIARDGEKLVAWTLARSWKVKRVRRDPRVTLQPSGRTGKVRDGEVELAGSAEVISDPVEVGRVEELIKRKYGFEFRVVTLVEAILNRGRPERVVLSITPST